MSLTTPNDVRTSSSGDVRSTVHVQGARVELDSARRHETRSGSMVQSHGHSRGDEADATGRIGLDPLPNSHGVCESNRIGIEPLRESKRPPFPPAARPRQRVCPLAGVISRGDPRRTATTATAAAESSAATAAIRRRRLGRVRLSGTRRERLVSPGFPDPVEHPPAFHATRSSRAVVSSGSASVRVVAVHVAPADHSPSGPPATAPPAACTGQVPATRENASRNACRARDSNDSVALYPTPSRCAISSTDRPWMYLHSSTCPYRPGRWSSVTCTSCESSRRPVSHSGSPLPARLAAASSAIRVAGWSSTNDTSVFGVNAEAVR